MEVPRPGIKSVPYATTAAMLGPLNYYVGPGIKSVPPQQPELLQ